LALAQVHAPVDVGGLARVTALHDELVVFARALDEYVHLGADERLVLLARDAALEREELARAVGRDESRHLAVHRVGPARLLVRVPEDDRVLESRPLDERAELVEIGRGLAGVPDD